MFTKQTLAAVVGAFSLASASTIPASASMPSLAEIEQAAATAVPYSPVSNVKGLAFDRFTQIWFENTVSQFNGSGSTLLTCEKRTTTLLLVMSTSRRWPRRVSS